MEILIFGANGQDGQYLRRLAQERGWRVAAVARQQAPIIGDVADASLVVGTTSVGNRHPQLAVRRLEFGARLIRRRREKSISDRHRVFRGATA